MRKFYILTVFLSALAMLMAALTPQASALEAPKIEAQGSLLVEVTDGQVLYVDNMHARVAPGGLAKVMTLLVAVRAVEAGAVSLEDSVAASPAALNAAGSYGGALHIAEGETMSLRDLLYCAFIAPSGDACSIVAEHIAGSADAFAALMNSEAAHLGCFETHFNNADGSPDPGQYTTGWDQYLILREAVNHVLFLQIAGTLSYRTVSSSRAPTRTVRNSNLLLDGKSAAFSKFCIAGKTDDTDHSQSSLVACARSGNRTLICVVIGAPGAADGEQPAPSYFAAGGLFEWGFSAFSWNTVLTTTEVVAQETVALAKGDQSVWLRPQETVTVLARTDLRPDEIRREIIVYNQAEGKTLTAPVRAGDILGEISVTIDGVVRGRTKLVAEKDVALDTTSFMKLKIASALSNDWVQLGAGLLVVILAVYIGLVIRYAVKKREERRQIEDRRKKLIEERKAIRK